MTIMSVLQKLANHKGIALDITACGGMDSILNVIDEQLILPTSDDQQLHECFELLQKALSGMTIICHYRRN